MKFTSTNNTQGVVLTHIYCTQCGDIIGYTGENVPKQYKPETVVCAYCQWKQKEHGVYTYTEAPIYKQLREKERK